MQLPTIAIFATIIPLIAALPAIDNASSCRPRPASPRQQRAIFDDFYQTLFVQKNVTLAFSKHISDSYIQHSPLAPSGTEAAVELLSSILPTTNFTLANKSFDNNLGWLHHKGQFAGDRDFSALVDIFRMEGACIVEHWDVIQMNPENAISPMF